MAVTNYYTIDGQMIGYKDAGGRKDFLTDALGSVTGEVDQTGTNRTFNGRYKPYGGMLWASGSKGSFGWVGTWGYKSTGLKNSSHYVRARHYSQTSGMWTTQDPLWPKEATYRYVSGKVTSQVDMFGMFPGVSAELETLVMPGIGPAITTFPRVLPPGVPAIQSCYVAIIIVGVVAGVDLINYGATGNVGPITVHGDQIGRNSFEDPYAYTTPLYIPSRTMRKPRNCNEAGHNVHNACDRQGPRNYANLPTDREEMCWEIRKRFSRSRDCYEARMAQERICGRKGPNNTTDPTHQREIDNAWKSWRNGLELWTKFNCDEFL